MSSSTLYFFFKLLKCNLDLLKMFLYCILFLKGPTLAKVLTFEKKIIEEYFDKKKGGWE